LIPITSPLASKSGPPEFPGFTATSVCRNGTYPSPGSERERAETIPALALFSNPNGDPIASTHSPTRTRDGSPILTVGRSFASILSTATSLLLSLPTTFALNSRLSVSRTVTSVAPSTTCALVAIVPSLSITKPDPVDVPCCSCGMPKSNGLDVRWTIWAVMNATPGASRL
jgi:hypothetical protein